MNEFQQVSSDGHQMSLVGGPCSVRSHVLRWGGGHLSREVPCLEGGGLFIEDQCIMGNGHMGHPSWIE